jgi:glycosyltransferase involved in cell wall biosynthesis
MKNSIPSLVSVVMPTRNRAHFLQDSLASVLCQTYKNIEVIVHNNNSKDNTRDIVNGFNDNRIRYFETDEDLTLLDNWSRAVDKVTGKYFIRFDDDNYLFPNFIETALSILDSENLDAITFNSYVIDQVLNIKLLHKYDVIKGNKIKIFNANELLYLTYHALIDSNYTIYNYEKLRSVKSDHLYHTTLPDRHLDYHLCTVIEKNQYKFGYFQIPYSITRFDHDPSFIPNYVYKKFSINEINFNNIKKIDLHQNFIMHKFSTLIDFLSKTENYNFKRYVNKELVNLDLLYEMSLFYNIYEAKRLLTKKEELFDYLSDNFKLLTLVLKKPFQKTNDTFLIKYFLFVLKNICLSIYFFMVNKNRNIKVYNKQIGDNIINNFDKNSYKNLNNFISDYIN